MRGPSQGVTGLLLSVTLSVVSLATQAETSPNQAAPAEQRAAPLRVTTRLVQVNVIVRDKKGEPLTGLTRDEFTLLDQGRPQKIAVFSEEIGGALSAPPRPLPPNVYSNRLDEIGQVPGSVTVILFDALNTAITDQAYARQEILKFLRRLQPQDHVAIYTLTTQLRVLHEFTQDTASLLNAVNQYKGSASPALDASTPQPADNPLTPPAPGMGGVSTGMDTDVSALAQRFERFIQEADARISDFYTVNRATLTCEAIEAIASHVAHIPGRKNLVWVSGSFPIAIGFGEETLPGPGREMRTFGPELERAARAMNQANLAIYPVDARGLMVHPQFTAAQRGGFDPRRPRMVFMSTLNFDTMNTLADRTGGRAFYNTNDITGSVRRAFEDAQITYQLGFYPEHGRWDGKFHDIKVKVDRPGVQLRFRRGYFASPDPPDDEKERTAALHGAIVSPIESSALGMEVEVHPARSRQTPVLELVVRLDLRELTLEQQNDRWKGALDLVFHQTDSTGKELNNDEKHIGLNLTQSTYDSILKDGMGLVRHLPMAAGASTLRIVVRDSTSGALGTVTVPLKTYVGRPDTEALGAQPNRGAKGPPQQD